MRVEVCVDMLEGLEAAIAGGAHRVELCAALDLGGLTPSAGMMRAAADMAAETGVPVFTMMRPRAGDFIWSGPEIALICADIAMARQTGLAGVVLGASLPDGRLDGVALARMVDAAQGMDLTLHRCFDLVPDLAEAVELAVQLGFQRILTSGRAGKAAEGLADLALAQGLAAGRIGIMPGSGVTAGNAALFRALGVGEIHASCTAPVAAADTLRRFGFATPGQRRTRADLVAALVAAAA